MNSDGQNWYHGSPHCLEPGEVLTPGAKDANFPQSRPGVVSITTEPDYALRWGREAAEKLSRDHTHVYRVEPIGPVVPWRVRPKNYGEDFAHDEANVPQATVVEMVFGHGKDVLPVEDHSHEPARRNPMGYITTSKGRQP
ncbi:hypothetical protein [Tessaracoccus sp.]